MSRFGSDDTLWPLCITLACGRPSLEDHMRMIEAWDSWLTRRERFTSLRVHFGEDALEQSPGVARATKEWFRGGARERIGDFVSAMAIVVPPALHPKTARMSVETVFGIPGGIFADLDEALDWLREHGEISAEIAVQARRIVDAF